MQHQELLKFFHKNYPHHVKAMRESDHNFDSSTLNPYHLEGTVFEHVMMVLNEAVKRNYGFETELAALLHDLGKPTVREETEVLFNAEHIGKVTFYNHDPLSAFLSLSIMQDLGLKPAVKERLFKVIALHTDVFKRPLQKLYDLIQDDKTFDLLLRLAECDHLGRFTDIPSNINYNFQPTVSEPAFERHILGYTKSKCVVLLCGLPYAGKSTYIEKCKQQDAFDPCTTYIISRDSIIDSLEGENYNDKWNNADQKLVDAKLQEMFKESKKYKDVIVDMTHMSTKSRGRTLSHYGKDWYKECIVLLPTMEKINERKLIRTDKIISDTVLQNMILSFRPPLLGEGFDNIEYRF